MSRIGLNYLLILVLAAIVLATTPARLTAETNYCALVTPQEAANELHAASTAPGGDKAPKPSPGSPVKTQQCTFRAPGAIPYVLNVGFQIVPSAAFAHQNLQGNKEMFSALGKVSSVSGVGDEAFWNPDGQLIFFCKHTVCVEVQGGADPIKYKDAADRLRAFAVNLAAKLP